MRKIGLLVAALLVPSMLFADGGILQKSIWLRNSIKRMRKVMLSAQRIRNMPRRNLKKQSGRLHVSLIGLMNGRASWLVTISSITIWVWVMAIPKSENLKSFLHRAILSKFPFPTVLR